MNYLLSFSPWIAYAIVGSVGSWRTGVIVAAVIQGVLLISLLRKRQLDLLSIGTLMFFAAMSVLVLIAQIAGFVIPFQVTQKTVAAARTRAFAAGVAV